MFTVCVKRYILSWEFISGTTSFRNFIIWCQKTSWTTKHGSDPFSTAALGCFFLPLWFMRMRWAQVISECCEVLLHFATQVNQPTNHQPRLGSLHSCMSTLHTSQDKCVYIAYLATLCALTKWLLKRCPAPPLALVNGQVMMCGRSDSRPCQWSSMSMRPACLPLSVIKLTVEVLWPLMLGVMLLSKM